MYVLSAVIYKYKRRYIYGRRNTTLNSLTLVRGEKNIDAETLLNNRATEFRRDQNVLQECVRRKFNWCARKSHISIITEDGKGGNRM